MKPSILRATITAAAVSLLLSVSASAQCLQGNAQLGSFFKTTGDPQLDTKFNQEGNLLWGVFGIHPNMLIFDDGGSPNAFASPQITNPGWTGTVYFGIGLLRDELWKDLGGYAVSGIMAHEFAHILQLQKHSQLAGKQRELHADYMAGYYLSQKTSIAPTSVPKFANSLYRKGDFAFWSPAHHGTPDERVAAMIAGFKNSGADVTGAYSAGEDFVRGSPQTRTARVGGPSLSQHTPPRSNSQTDAHAMQECLNRKVQSCIKDCEDNYGYSHEQCVNVLCTLNEFNLSKWSPACRREVKRRAEAESKSDD